TSGPRSLAPCAASATAALGLKIADDTRSESPTHQQPRPATAPPFNSPPTTDPALHPTARPPPAASARSDSSRPCDFSASRSGRPPATAPLAETLSPGALPSDHPAQGLRDPWRRPVHCGPPPARVETG